MRQAVKLAAFPAVYHNLQAAGAQLPEDWNRWFRLNYVQNVAIQQEEARLVEDLNRAGLECRAIKGCGLVELLYPDLSWRAIADIDLLAPRHQVGRIYDALKAQGLSDAVLPWTPEGLSRQIAQPDYAFAEIILRTRRGTVVELHWDWPGESFPAGNPANQREAFLLYLCRHAGKHFWSSLQNLSDLELFLRRFGGEIDWDRFWRLARRTGWERVCTTGFQVCANVFDRPLSPGERRADSRAARLLSRRAVTLLLSDVRPWWWRSLPLRLLRVYSWRQRAGRCLRWMAPPPWDWNHPEASSGVGVWVHRYLRMLLRLVARLTPVSRWRARLEKAAELRGCDWGCLARAFVTLTLVRLALPVFSFERVQRWAATVRDRSQAGADPNRTAWLVEAAANAHPLRMLCLPRSVTLVRLLSRQGIATELKVGVQRQDRDLRAHAWVEWQGQPLNDPGRIVQDYSELARIPTAGVGPRR